MSETLYPIPMTPAFRAGALTPWGGDRLKTIWAKPIPETPTGECLEVSCIPGLESRNPEGTPLPDLIARYGESLVGRYAGKPFPLLLKLIDARESLSVQVHPTNAYAAKYEGGKLGKTEAWLILDTPPEGGELVYGLRPGETLASLRTACEGGKTVEPLLRRVTVFPGDVCYIPAGCVHAIGAGIMLYEIQESSDLTYRFYDWDRVDAAGQRRQLHLEKALAVTNLTLAPEPVRAERTPGVRRVLQEAYFSLDLIRGDGRKEIGLPQVSDFAMLTVLEGAPELVGEGIRMAMEQGDTCLIPKSCPPLALRGRCAAAMAMPGAE